MQIRTPYTNSINTRVHGQRDTEIYTIHKYLPLSPFFFLSFSVSRSLCLFSLCLFVSLTWFTARSAFPTIRNVRTPAPVTGSLTTRLNSLVKLRFPIRIIPKFTSCPNHPLHVPVDAHGGGGGDDDDDDDDESRLEPASTEEGTEEGTEGTEGM